MSKKETQEVLGYKIKHNLTGFYLRGFSMGQARWSKKGRIWSTRAYLTSSIKRSIADSKRYNKSLDSKIIDDLGNWDIIELIFSNSYPVAFVINKLT